MAEHLHITLLPAFHDNYIFMIENEAEHLTAVVDPGDPTPVLMYLSQHNKKLDYILNTHHHNDHIGGNAKLKAETGCKIVAFEGDQHRIPTIDILVREHDTFSLGQFDFTVIETVGHTLGHISYYCENNGQPVLFCGDTVFAMGCGRLFEGSPEDLYESFEKLKKLPPETKIYCAHEYTLNNAKFALSVEPDNQAIQERVQQEQSKQDQNRPTIPTTLEKELKTNLFLQAKSPQELGRLRALKDSY